MDRRWQLPGASARLVMEAQTRADDGMDLLRVETFQAPTAAGLPKEAELIGKIDKMATDLEALAKSAGRGTLRGPGHVERKSCGGIFSRSAGTPTGRPPAARRR